MSMKSDFIGRKHSEKLSPSHWCFGFRFLLWDYWLGCSSSSCLSRLFHNPLYLLRVFWFPHWPGCFLSFKTKQIAAMATLSQASISSWDLQRKRCHLLERQSSFSFARTKKRTHFLLNYLACSSRVRCFPDTRKAWGNCTSFSSRT